MPGKVTGRLALLALRSRRPCQPHVVRNLPAQSQPIVLITADEAKRPRQPTADLSFRAGISRGPAINLLIAECGIGSTAIPRPS